MQDVFASIAGFDAYESYRVSGFETYKGATKSMSLTVILLFAQTFKADRQS